MLARGQLTTPQNKAMRPTAAPKAGSSPSRGATALPKAAPIKKVGTISPAPEARSQSEGGKRHFQQESPRVRPSACKHTVQKGAACAVVGPAALQHRQQDDQRRPCQHPEVGIGQNPTVQPG